ncbi:MAG: hypothetical protein H0T73_14015 [Ardenticatenales bacterium]|nr:hypothetical protein [Ardenticatenales bacterium]
MQERNNGLLALVGSWLGLGGAERAEAEEVEPLGVTWMLLPPYDIPGMAVVSGLLVENQGAEDEQDVYISLTFSGERFITHMEVLSDDPYDLSGGTPRDSHLTLLLPRLRAGKKVVIYVAGHSPQTPEVTVAVQYKPSTT